MATTNAKSAIDNLCTEMQSKNTAQVLVQGAKELSNGFARIVATVTHANGSRDTKSSLINALRAKFDNKLHVVPDSFTVLSSNNISDTVTGIMSLAPQAIPYTENIAGFKAIAGNMFMDDEESLWALRKTEAGDILVKSLGADDADEVSGLLQSVASSGFNGAYESTAAVEKHAATLAGVTGGDFVTYICPEKHVVTFGAVVASVRNNDGSRSNSVCVLDKNDGFTQIIDRDMILASWNDVKVPDIDDEALATNGNNVHSIESIAAYYKTVFQRDPSYYEEFMARWRNHTFA